MHILHLRIPLLAALVLSLAPVKVAAQSAPSAAPALETAVTTAPHATPANGPEWAMLLPADSKVSFKGVVNFDSAGSGQGAMLYPGFGGAAGFFAAVITHGLVNESVKNSQKTKMEEEADKVLVPYQSVLSSFTHTALAHDALQLTTLGSRKRVLEPGSRTSTEWMIESLPVFSMTQDQSAIILDHAIKISQPGSASVRYTNAIRVVSSPLDEADLAAFWTANQGEKLRMVSARLLAQSLDIALEDAGKPAAAAPQRTVRYFEGKQEKMERAEFLRQDCGRALIKTLRGWLMSVPAKPGLGQENQDQCTNQLAKTL